MKKNLNIFKFRVGVGENEEKIPTHALTPQIEKHNERKGMLLKRI
jgi:hypothetical protein